MFRRGKLVILKIDAQVDGFREKLPLPLPTLYLAPNLL